MTGDVDSMEYRIRRLEEAARELEERIERIEAVLYGNGRQGVLARLAVIETKIEQLNSTMKWAVVFTAGTFLGIIITIVTLIVQGG